MIHQIKAQYFPICEYFENKHKILKSSSNEVEVYAIYWHVKAFTRIINSQFNGQVRVHVLGSIK